jgi:hypothetical protein
MYLGWQKWRIRRYFFVCRVETPLVCELVCRDDGWGVGACKEGALVIMMQKWGVITSRGTFVGYHH